MKQKSGIMNEKRMGRDLTQGNIFRLLLSFALPYMAANFLTSLYTLVDLSIIGLFTDSVGVSAVSNAGNIVMLHSAISLALGGGGGILIAQLIGAGRTDELGETIGTLISLCVSVSLALLVSGIFLAEPLIRLLNTPEEAVAQAAEYLRIVCLGLPFYFCWNAFSEILRGMGDSLTPLLILLVSSLLNTVLDLLFVAAFRWGAAGAAAATSLSMVLAAAFAWVYLYRRRGRFRFDFRLRSFAMKWDKLRLIARLSGPLVAMQVAINCSMIYVNTFINSYGVIASAVAGIGTKLYSVSNIVCTSVQNAASAMVGQNMGAEKPERAGRTVWAGWAINFGFFLFLGTAVLTIPEMIFGIFSNDAEVIAMSRDYMRIAFWMYLAFALMAPPIGLITGVGATGLNFVIALLDGVLARVGLSLLFGITLGMGLEGFWRGNALACYISVILPSLYFFSGKWKTRRLLKR